ncbi:hypothetical protein [Halogranum rubrum]|uniref:Uncharacterized protein n=1 Tax=Halogranum salarium B-1 TaxID=1210908 RepID=J3EVQ3_9EURY|nr:MULTISPECIES: hypothetical protein [Halogranum]EJN58742.1 hypothetical protein HSB1_32200 [Halogranum salarium B-1]
MGFVDRYPVFTLTVLAGALYALGRLATSRLGVDPLVVGVLVAGVLVVAWRLSRLS